MKKTILAVFLACCMLLVSACGAGDTIIGRWETESNAADLGLNLNGNFISTITRISFLEEGVGTWEIELVQTREILRREFSFTLEDENLTISYPDGTAQQFQVTFDDGILILRGLENLSLKRIGS